MNEILLPVLTGLLLLAEFLVALAAYSLRDYSLSRLDEICRSLGRESRFGIIMKRDEDALLAAELLLTLITIALVGVASVWLDLWTLPVEALGWALHVGAWVAALAVLLASAVVVPWTIARVAGEQYLYRVWPLLSGLVVVARPFLSAARSVDRLMHRLGGLQEPTNGGPETLSEEIRTVIDEGEREGLLEVGARTMIQRVMELQKEDTAAIMTPRTDMVVIPADASLEEARQKLLDAGHSRVPVIGESTDDIIGILYAKDLLKYFDVGNGRPVALKDIVREPLYVPETTGIDKLLEMMKRERVQLAIVVDEYGGVAGLVSMEDILEEIVGEISDEYDLARETAIRTIEPDVIEVDARVHIDELNEQFGFDLPEDGDYDTIGGFVFSELGRIPSPGETFTWRQLRITVLVADKRKIDKLRIEVDLALAAASTEET